MAYVDEKMIKDMNAYKKGQYGTIETGIYIKEELYEFERIKLFDGKMEIALPKKFFDMPMDVAKLKYPMEQRPSIIKTDESMTVNFTFSLLELPLMNENVEECNKFLYKVIKRSQPVNKFLDQKLLASDDLIIGWFDYISRAYDDDLYNLMYCFPVQGKTLHAVFNCRFSEIEIWKPIVLDVIKTIKVLKEE